MKKVVNYSTLNGQRISLPSFVLLVLSLGRYREVIWDAGILSVTEGMGKLNI